MTSTGQRQEGRVTLLRLEVLDGKSWRFLQHMEANAGRTLAWCITADSGLPARIVAATGEELTNPDLPIPAVVRQHVKTTERYAKDEKSFPVMPVSIPELTERTIVRMIETKMEAIKARILSPPEYRQEKGRIGKRILLRRKRQSQTDWESCGMGLAWDREEITSPVEWIVSYLPDAIHRMQRLAGRANTPTFDAHGPKASKTRNGRIHTSTCDWEAREKGKARNRARRERNRAHVRQERKRDWPMPVRFHEPKDAERFAALRDWLSEDAITGSLWGIAQTAATNALLAGIRGGRQARLEGGKLKQGGTYRHMDRQEAEQNGREAASHSLAKLWEYLHTETLHGRADRERIRYFWRIGMERGIGAIVRGYARSSAWEVVRQTRRMKQENHAYQDTQGEYADGRADSFLDFADPFSLQAHGEFALFLSLLTDEQSDYAAWAMAGYSDQSYRKRQHMGEVRFANLKDSLAESIALHWRMTRYEEETRDTPTVNRKGEVITTRRVRAEGTGELTLNPDAWQWEKEKALARRVKRAEQARERMQRMRARQKEGRAQEQTP